MWFRNLQIYRLPAPWNKTAADLEQALAIQAFTPATSNELLRQGWAAPRGAGAPLVHAVGGQFLMQLRTEKKLLPASVINQVAAARAAELEEAQGFAPGKKAMKELKERVADELLPRAFSITSETFVWIDPVNGWLAIDAASSSKADDVIKLLLKSVDRMPLESLRVQRSQVAVMTAWLETDEAPVGFTVDRDAELRATGESKAAVRYVKHALEVDDVRRHIAAGKQCTRLAMTWNDKISFVLTESLAIKSVKALDVLTENGGIGDAGERFDGDFALMAGELAKMLTDLVAAMGGEAMMDVPGEQKAAPAGMATGDEPVRQQIPVLSLNDHIAGQLAQRGMTLRDLELKTQGEVPAGDGSAADPLYETAVTVVRTNQRASISLVQRHLHIGDNRAARLLEAMEASGVISTAASNGNREFLPCES